MNRMRLLLGALLAGTLVVSPTVAQEFGGTVLFVDGQLLITESFDPAGGGPDGTPRTIYVYTRAVEGWEQTGTIQAPEHEGADFFGRFMVRDGDQLIVGATALDDGNGQSSGSVLIYRRSGDDWEFQSYLRPESVPVGASFGRFASLGGDLLVVSALGYNGVGGAWVFERGEDGWVEQGILTPSAPDPQQELFGWGVHTDGERIIVGAAHGQQFTGAAYVFGRDAEGNWIEEAVLALPAEEAQPLAIMVRNDRAPSFGVRIDGSRALMGLPGVDNGAGTVLHYKRRYNGDWVRTGSLSAFDRQPGAGFGAGFHDREGELWISAPGANPYGAIYAFASDPNTDTFGSATKVGVGAGSDRNDGFGLSMASANTLAAIGQPWDDSGLGSVIVLEDRGDGWVQTGKVFIPEERRALAALSEVECSESGMADQFSCSQVDVLSFLPLDAIGGTDRGISANDVWGWTDPQTGREYALVGRTDGVAFIDVSSPSDPVYLGNLAKTPGSQTNAWRDIKVFDSHAFVVADGAGQHGMQIFDLTRLRDVRDAPVEFEADALYDAFGSAHNVVINEGTGTAYAVGVNSGGETCGGGLHMIDINSPKDPSFLGCFADAGTGRSGTGYSHDAMCIDYDGPDTEHAGQEICFGANENAISIADVTDKSNPVSLATATYPAAAYTHQGWITEDHRYFYVGDELDEMASVAAADSLGVEPDMAGSRTLIWDVSDLDDPVLVKEHIGETFTIDHNLYIVGDLMYQSNYVSGLRVLDISDRENPVEVGFLDTVPWDESITFDGSWSNYPFFESGTIIVSSGKEGVFFVKYRRPELVP